MQPGCIILAEAPEALVEVCGISVLERLLRTLSRCGIKRADVLSSTLPLIVAQIPEKSWARPDLALAFHNRADDPANFTPPATGFLLVRGDTIFDPRLLQRLLKQERGAVLIDSASEPAFRAAALAPSGSTFAPNRNLLDDPALAVIKVADEPPYSPSLRRNLQPYCFSPADIRQIDLIEHRLVDATQKGAQDFPAIIHAPIEKFLAARLCKTRITPHLLTIAWIILGFAVTALFATGHLAWGILLAFIIGILDGVDGKLARLRVETSSIGTLEHRFDSLFEVGWPAVLAFYFYQSGQLPNAATYFFLLLAAQAVDGIAKGVIYKAFATMMRPPDIIDRVIRFVGGRRNIFVWILLVSLWLGVPAKALIVTAWWWVATTLLDLPHAIRVRHLATRSCQSGR